MNLNIFQAPTGVEYMLQEDFMLIIPEPLQTDSTTAERTGFEPVIRFWRIHAFQACLFNHSSTSPFQFSGESQLGNAIPYDLVCKSILFFHSNRISSLKIRLKG